MNDEPKIKCPNCATEMDLPNAVRHAFRERELILLEEKRKLEEKRQNIRFEATRTLDIEREKVVSRVHEAIKEIADREQFKLAEKDQIIGRLQQQVNQLRQSVKQGSDAEEV